MTVPLADPVKGDGERSDWDEDGVRGVGVVDAEDDRVPVVDIWNVLEAESVRIR